MKHQKITNLLSEASDSIFVTRKWNNVNDKPNANYDVENKFIYNTEVLKSNFCNYSDVFIIQQTSCGIIFTLSFC